MNKAEVMPELTDEKNNVATLSDGIKRYAERVFSRCDISNTTLKKFTHARLDYVSGKRGSFVDVDFSYSTMSDCYFHEATFTNCKFVGARFYRCNFRGVKFENCNFSYIDANETKIPFDDLIRNLPDSPNVAREICQVMRRNANSLGDMRDSRGYIIEELNQRKEHLRRAIRGQGEYYKKKYGGFKKRLLLRMEAAFLDLDSIIWGHGEKIWKITIPLGGSVIIASAIQTAFWAAPLESVDLKSVGQHGIDAAKYYASFLLSVNIPIPSPQLIWLEWILSIIRLVALGLLVSSLFRWLSHR